MRMKRVYMAEADGAGGSAAPAAAPKVEPQAQGAEPAAIDKKIVEEVRNSIYAELRRNGVLKKSAAAALDGQAPKPEGQQPQPTAATDYQSLRALDRNLARLGFADKLSDAQHRRIEKAYLEERPENAEAWVKDYFGGLGPASNAQPAPQSPAQPRNAHPASDAGAPARSEVPLEEKPIIEMTPEEVEHLVRRVGHFKYRAMLTQQLKGKRVNIRE